jgi:hypothetical protein
MVVVVVGCIVVGLCHVVVVVMVVVDGCCGRFWFVWVMSVM